MKYIIGFFIIFFSFILVYNAKYVEPFDGFPTSELNTVSKDHKSKIDKLTSRMAKISNDQNKIDSYYIGKCENGNSNNCGDIPELSKKFNNIKKPI